MTVSYATAFIGGLITILAPCASMLLPAFFAYAFSSRRAMASRTLAFTLGLIAALVPLGVAAGSLGQMLINYRSTVSMVAGIIIIVLGIILALSLPFPHLRLPSSKGSGGQSATVPAVFILGITYGLAGAGCTGPILGGVLLVAGHTGSIVTGSLVMAFYALGMATPVVLLAFLWDALDIGSRGFLRPKPVTVLGRTTTVGALISGALFVVLGLALIFTGGLSNIAILNSIQQAHIEEDAMRIFNAIPNWLFLIMAVVLIAIIALLFRQISIARAAARAKKEASRTESAETDAS